MEYGIDSYGNIVHHSNAFKYGQFYCPYCTEEVDIIRGSSAKKGHFAHKKKKSRTPLEMACPEYHETASYKRISNQLDRLYINNGGVPLYLHSRNKEFELRAYFPRLNEVNMQKLIQDRAKLVINNQTHYYVENLNYYTLDYIQDWINIKIDPDSSNEEVRRKWLWGIRGIDIYKDIYHANSEGGYRLAIKANMYIGKKYRIMFVNKPSKIEGVIFDLKGQIKLKENNCFNNFNVYEMKIIRFTEEARQFVESRGYHLLQKSSQLTPVWPPAINRGNELIFDSENVWFYHSLENEEEYLYEVGEKDLYRIPRKKIIKIRGLSKTIEKTLIVSNVPFQNQQKIQCTNEIKYMLVHRNQLVDKKELVPEIIVKNSDGKELDLANKDTMLPSDRRIFVATNLTIDVLLKKDSYILCSAKNWIEGLGYGKNLSIDCKGFGTINYEFKRYTNELEHNQKINWEEVYTCLYKCGGAITKPSYSNYHLLKNMGKSLNDKNKKVYDLIYRWVKQEKVPVRAQFYLEYILKRGFGK